MVQKPPPPPQTMMPKPWERKPDPNMPKYVPSADPYAGVVFGRPKKVPDVDTLLNAAEDYVRWANDNPLYKNKSAVHDGKVIQYKEPVKRPLTKIGFARFLHVNETTVRRFMDPRLRDEEFVETAKAVFNLFDSELLEGGITSLYNSNITSRILQLADHIKTDAQPPVAPAIDPMDIPDKVHPNDPDPFSENPLLFSQRQLDAGIKHPDEDKLIEGEAVDA